MEKLEWTDYQSDIKYMNQNLVKDGYKRTIKIEQDLLKAIPELFSVKTGQNPSPVYKGIKWIHPRHYREIH